MAQAQINAIQQGITQMIQFVQSTGMDAFSDEVKLDLAQAISQATDRIAQLREQMAQSPEAPAPQIPPGADLLWILAGHNDAAFVSYLNNFPDPALNALLRNPTQLTQVIEHLQRTMPQGELPSEGGIPHAPLESSNIYGFRYDPKSGRLLVRFQSGSVYGYDGVPAGVFQVFQQGAVPARTQGQNEFGRWWIGKQPSLGSAFYNLIRQGGYSYQQLS